MARVHWSRHTSPVTNARRRVPSPLRTVSREHSLPAPRRPRGVGWFANRPLAVKFGILIGVVVLAFGGVVGSVMIGNADVREVSHRARRPRARLRRSSSSSTPAPASSRSTASRPSSARTRPSSSPSSPTTSPPRRRMLAELDGDPADRRERGRRSRRWTRATARYTDAITGVRRRAPSPTRPARGVALGGHPGRQRPHRRCRRCGQGRAARGERSRPRASSTRRSTARRRSASWSSASACCSSSLRQPR